MSLYDAFEALDYGSPLMTLEAAKQAVDDSLSPCVLSRESGEIIHVSICWNGEAAFMRPVELYPVL